MFKRILFGTTWLLAGFLALLLSACGGGEAPATSEGVLPAPSSNVVFIGDSITAGWNFPASINATNLGIPGQTTDQMSARFAAVLELHPKAIIIFGGSNDMRIRNSASVDDLRSMAQRGKDSGAIVVIALIPPITGQYSPTGVNSVEVFDAAVAAMALELGVSVADFYSATTNHGAQNSALFTDGIHPNAAGYAAMQDVLEPILRGLPL